MAAVKITKKDMAQDDFIAGVFDFGEWLEAHWRQVAIGGGAAIALVLLGVGWNSMRESAASEANRLLASGIEAFSPTATQGAPPAAPRFPEALTFFEQAEQKAGSQGVGEIARMFRARTLISLGRATEAVPLLEKLMKSNNEGLAASAKVSLAQALETTGDPERAATLLQEVASQTKGAAYPQDAALLQLASLRARQGKKDEAKRVYDDLIARFPQSPFAADAHKQLDELTGTAK